MALCSPYRIKSRGKKLGAASAYSCRKLWCLDQAPPTVWKKRGPSTPNTPAAAEKPRSILVRYRDIRTQQLCRISPLTAQEFIGRFLQRVLPQVFPKSAPMFTGVGVPGEKREQAPTLLQARSGRAERVAAPSPAGPARQGDNSSLPALSSGPRPLLKVPKTPFLPFLALLCNC